MKIVYIKPELEVVHLEFDEIITTSGGTGGLMEKNEGTGEGYQFGQVITP